MMITDLRLGDMNQVRALHEKFYKDEFDFPLRHELFDIKIVRCGNQIIGMGAVRPIYEVIMILDKKQRLKTKVNVLKLLLNESQSRNQVHAFVQDDNFASILQNHFGFKPIVGTGLIR